MIKNIDSFRADEAAGEHPGSAFPPYQGGSGHYATGFIQGNICVTP
jgi:hypothetical protein